MTSTTRATVANSTGASPRMKAIICARSLKTSSSLGERRSKVTGAAHDVNGASHVHEERFIVALDERDLFRALLENLLDARAKLIEARIFLIDLDFAVLGNLDDNGFVFQLDVLLLIGIRLRHEGIETLRNKGRDHHENDDQHQKNINQRYYVGRCERAALFSNFHPHGVIS